MGSNVFYIITDGVSSICRHPEGGYVLGSDKYCSYPIAMFDSLEKAQEVLRQSEEKNPFMPLLIRRFGNENKKAGEGTPAQTKK